MRADKFICGIHFSGSDVMYFFGVHFVDFRHQSQVRFVKTDFV